MRTHDAGAGRERGGRAVGVRQSGRSGRRGDDARCRRTRVETSSSLDPRGKPVVYDSQRAGDARRRQGLRWHGRGGTETTGRRTRKPGARESLGAYLSLSDLRRHRARAAVAGNAVPRTLRRPRARRCAMRADVVVHSGGQTRVAFGVIKEFVVGFQYGLSATLDASRTRQAAVHARDAQKNTFITRARTRVSHPTNIAFSARHDPPRGCVFRPPRRGGGENITLAKKNTRLVTRPPPRWLFRGGTPPRSCTGTWRARRRPPPRRWRRSR